MDSIILITGIFLAVAVAPRIIGKFYGIKEGENAPLSTPEIEKAVKENHQAIVYFYTSKCPACKVMSPTITKVKRLSGVPLVKVNAHKEPQAANEYKVMGVPATFVIQDGIIKGKLVGAKGEEELKALL